MKKSVLLLFCALIAFSSLANAQQRFKNRKTGELRKVRDNIRCSGKNLRNRDAYNDACHFLQSFYIKSPDRQLARHLRNGLQVAANRILPLIGSDKRIRMDVVKHCAQNLQTSIDILNDDAVRAYRNCNKKCLVNEGNRFSREIENVGIGIASCITQSIY
uniref:Putative secreted salivary protein n=1 Tax=Culicoides sonorensis TaxID=179676 RepID=Q66U28_CULSO|nr:putative secreted salivary protein [Culicoides sonorensis]